MGLYKLVWTSRKNRSELLDLDSRAAARTIIARWEQVRQFERQRAIASRQLEKSVIMTAYLQLGYVGNTPSVPGSYLVVDSDTGGIQYVTVNSRMSVREPFASVSIPLDRFNMGSFRWFIMGKLDPVDVAGLQKLPTMQESTP